MSTSSTVTALNVDAGSSDRATIQGDDPVLTDGGSASRNDIGSANTWKRECSAAAPARMEAARASNRRGISGDHRKDSRARKEKQGVTQRLVSAVRRVRGAGTGSATPAYLGVENRFRYDEKQKIWVMEGDENEGDDVSKDDRRWVGLGCSLEKYI